MKKDHFFWHPPKEVSCNAVFSLEVQIEARKSMILSLTRQQVSQTNIPSEIEAALRFKLLTLSRLRSNLTALTIKALAVLKPTNGKVRVVVELVVLPFHLGASQAILALYPSSHTQLPILNILCKDRLCLCIIVLSWNYILVLFLHLCVFRSVRTTCTTSDGPVCARARWIGQSKQKMPKIKTGHVYSHVKLNFGVGWFSCIFSTAGALVVVTV